MYTVNGREVVLNTKNFKAQGGEGAVYIIRDLAYKVYFDAAKMIPTGKIQELARISYPSVIKPLDIIHKNNIPFGFTMKNVDSSYVLCQLFPKAFRDRNQITPDTIMNLVQKMRDGVENVHQASVLLVDGNEMNFLVSTKFDDIYFIDVDSYQTNSYRAGALMESIRDRHMKGYNFTEETDWFSFGVVSFMMFRGIHPYKGKHQHYGTLDLRMHNNISVLNKDVGVPGVCLPQDVIPKIYQDWYYRIFEKGERCAPPERMDATTITFTHRVASVFSNEFLITNMYSLDDTVIWYKDEISITRDKVYIAGRMYKDIKGQSYVMKSDSGDYILVSLIGHDVEVYNLSQRKAVVCSLKASKLMYIDGRIYLVYNDTIRELSFINIPNGMLVYAKETCQFLQVSAQIFDSVLVQNMLGTYYVNIFSASGVCRQFPIEKLNSYRILDAKYTMGILCIIAEKGGEFFRFLYRFSEDFSQEDLHMDKCSSYYGINMTVLDNGICILLDEEEDLRIFRNKVGSASPTKLKNDIVDGSMTLYNNGISLVVADDRKLYKVEMKKSTS